MNIGHAGVRHFYAGGNTARGYRSFLDSIWTGTEVRIILTGDVEGLPSQLIQEAGERAIRQGLRVEWIHSPFVNGTYDGIVLPDRRAAVVDGGYPRQFQTRAPGLIERYLDLQEAVDREKLQPYRQEIVTLLERIHTLTTAAQQSFAEALRVHDDWEAVYIAHLDRTKANQVAEETVQLFFGNEKADKPARIRRMYLGAATPDGPRDFVPLLTAAAEKRYLIKGRPGSGKSTILKRLVAEAEARGFDAEVYHCGLDPNSLDMVVLPERGLAIFDSTAPHEYFPEKETDEVIDMYRRAIEPGTDEKYREKLMRFRTLYKEATKKGTAQLKEAEEARNRLARIYRDAADREKVSGLQASVCQLLGLA
ncbi:hypothetical protein KDJ56_16720 [Brevibacillus composti]|uniref:Nucleotide kinase n=1 Tax=Brevibacillus composti TaxID=2796470 RepID=A0A7T5JMM6_9BACL|nr:hypothetical protein [Brevibacillus composti]QQE73528.1 hypothetical protein JD108_16775 [Brevibacillus composti]QUO40610.1 hypothetical protein KDJ56_16720 [Brevibacillus composti]